MYGAPRKIQRKQGAKVTHVTRIAASTPAVVGSRSPGFRYAPRNPTYCTIWMRGPGVVSAIPRPVSISPGCSHPWASTASCAM